MGIYSPPWFPVGKTMQNPFKHLQTISNIIEWPPFANSFHHLHKTAIFSIKLV